MDWVRRPVRLKRFYKEYKDRSFSFLDIGCGNHSPTDTKRYFPHCVYHGVDREEYNNSPSDMRAMDQFYRIDLDKETLNSLPENHYDVVVAAHVLEHLENPYEVLKALISKLKKGGKIYLEFPSLKSLGLPSMEGTLQFCDDTTHVSLLNPYDIANILLRQGITIRKARLRRDWIRLLTSPLFLLDNVRRSLSGKKARSRGLWDLTGFAYYVYGEKI